MGGTDLQEASVLDKPMPYIDSIRAMKPKRLPVVLTRVEVDSGRAAGQQGAGQGRSIVIGQGGQSWVVDNRLVAGSIEGCDIRANGADQFVTSAEDAVGGVVDQSQIICGNGDVDDIA